jgi:hypothetical protein
MFSLHQEIVKLSEGNVKLTSPIKILIAVCALIVKEGTQKMQAINFKQLCLKLKQEYDEVEDYFSLLDKLDEIKLNMLAPSKDEDHTDKN